jgi:hypothetical protein
VQTGPETTAQSARGPIAHFTPLSRGRGADAPSSTFARAQTDKAPRSAATQGINVCRHRAGPRRGADATAG